MNPERKEKYDTQTNELYRAYGRFAVEFEQMCRSLKEGIMFTLTTDGLKNQDLVRVLLADQTASPLIAKFKAFVSIVYKDNLAEAKCVDKIFKACISINEQRNEIIHGTWFIGWANEEQTEFNVADGMKDKITKNGVEQIPLSHSAESFDELTEKVKIVADLINRLSHCIVFGFTPSTHLNLTKLNDTK
jgi:hypothetical protein